MRGDLQNKLCTWRSAPRKMSEEEDDTNKSVEVMGYKCAGMSDDNARQDVRRITFQELFASHNDIQIPIFQRAYCWTDEQLRKWWEDVDRTSADDGGHGVGNVMFKKVSRKGAVADGRADGEVHVCDPQRDGTYQQFVCCMV